MAKKAVVENVIEKVMYSSKEYKGYLHEMPQEAKDAIAARNPKAAKLFENK